MRQRLRPADLALSAVVVRHRFEFLLTFYRRCTEQIFKIVHNHRDKFFVGGRRGLILRGVWCTESGDGDRRHKIFIYALDNFSKTFQK